MLLNGGPTNFLECPFVTPRMMIRKAGFSQELDGVVGGVGGVVGGLQVGSPSRNSMIRISISSNSMIRVISVTSVSRSSSIFEHP